MGAFSATHRPTGAIAGKLLPYGLVGLIFVQQWLFGAEQPALSLLAALAELVLLLAVATAARSLRLPTAPLICAFAGLVAVACIQLVPVAALANPAWGYVGQTGIISLDPWAGRVELAKLSGLAALFVVAMQVGESDRWRPTFFRALLVAATVYGVWSFFDRILSPQTYLGLSRGMFSDRLTGSFLSANTAASLFGVYCVMAVCAIFHALARYKGAPQSKLLAQCALPVGLFLVSATCLMLTASRSGGAATIAVLLIVTALLTWSRSSKAKAGGGMAAVALGVIGLTVATYVLSGEKLTDRLGRLDGDLLTRTELYRTYWRAFQDAPWFGYGLGSFHQVNTQVAPPSNPTEFAFVGSAHNVYLQWLMEGGIAATAFMAAALAIIVLTCLRSFVADRSSRPYVLCALGALALLGLHGVTDFALQIPSISALLTTLLGLAYGQSRRRV